MGRNKRRHNRVSVDYEVVFFWEDAQGQVHTTRPRVRDASDAGMRVESTVPIEIGTSVCVDIPRQGSVMEAVVRYSAPQGAAFQVGLEFPGQGDQIPQVEESTRAEASPAEEPSEADGS